MEQILAEGKFKDILRTSANQTANYIMTLLLPVLTVISGLMGVSTVKTHRREIDFQEPNILWTCVASPPGNDHILVGIVLFLH